MNTSLNNAINHHPPTIANPAVVWETIALLSQEMIELTKSVSYE